MEFLAQQIIDDNRQICLALGMCDTTAVPNGSMKYGKNPLDIIWVKNQTYHCEWKSLMPVVEAFLKLGATNTKWSKADRFESYLRVSDFRDINLVYEPAVKFAKWYNSLSPERKQQLA